MSAQASRRAQSRCRAHAQYPHAQTEKLHSFGEVAQRKGSMSRTLSPVPSRQHILPPQPECDPEIVRVQRTVKSRPVTGHSKARLSPITPRLDSDSPIDAFLAKLSSMSVESALESFFKQRFQAKLVICWQEVPSLQLLYSQTANVTTMHASGIVGYSFFTRSVIRCANGPAHPSYQPEIDEHFCGLKSPVLVFPLWDWKNSLIYVVQVVKPVLGPEFTVEDEEFVQWFAEKFKVLSRWIIQTRDIESLSLDLLKVMSEDEFFANVIPKLAAFFKARRFEIWELNKEKGEIWRYREKKEKIQASMAGIAGDALNREETVSCANNRLHASYHPVTDGPTDEAVIACPIVDREMCYAFVMRGPEYTKVFLREDEVMLKKAIPTILLSLKNVAAVAKREEEFKSSRIEKEGFETLLEVAEQLSSQMDSPKLLENILTKGRELTDADRCSLFLVNDTRDRLVPYIDNGHEEPDIPISRGVAGKTISEGKVLNIPDAYETDFFDSTTDTETGYRTKSILSVPIFNNRGEIMGVTEMVNKYNSQSFSEWDAKMMQIFNKFCGISLENSRAFRESTYTANQLKVFFHDGFSLSRSQSTQSLLCEMMGTAREMVDAEFSSIFLVDSTNNVLTTYVSNGNSMPPTVSMNIGVGAHCVKQKDGAIVNSPYLSPLFNRMVDSITKCKTKNLCAAPIFGKGGVVIGVAELMNKKHGEFVSKDLQTLTAFAEFASIALENSGRKEMPAAGDEEPERSK